MQAARRVGVPSTGPNAYLVLDGCRCDRRRGGPAGLVATFELTRRGKRVAVVDQENAANLGGQAFWSFGGLLVDSPEQRRMRISDSLELAWNDWQAARASTDSMTRTCGPVDGRGPTWSSPPATNAVPVRSGIEFLPSVGWAERGDLTATGHGNSVPRFHVPGNRNRHRQALHRVGTGSRRTGLVTFHHRQVLKR